MYICMYCFIYHNFHYNPIWSHDTIGQPLGICSIELDVGLTAASVMRLIHSDLFSKEGSSFSSALKCFRPVAKSSFHGDL